MKARQWAQAFREAGADLADSLRAFALEAADLARKRGGSDLAAEGAVREQRAKWAAVCRLVPGLVTDFDALLAAYAPGLAGAEGRVKEAAARRRRKDDPGVLPGREMAERARRQ